MSDALTTALGSLEAALHDSEPIPSAPAPIERKKPGPKPGFRANQPHSPQKSYHKQPPINAPQIAVPNSDSFPSFLRADRAQWIKRYQSIPLSDALYELGQLRKLSEVAAEQANRRTVPDETKCWICQTPHPAHHKWTMIYPDRDPSTGTTTNRFIDTINCVQELQLRISRSKHVDAESKGHTFPATVKGLPDRGMVKGESA